MLDTSISSPCDILHQWKRFLLSFHNFPPCDRDFPLTKHKTKTTTVHHPEKWKKTLQNPRLITTHNAISL